MRPRTPPLRLWLPCVRCGTDTHKDFRDMASLESFAHSRPHVLCATCEGDPRNVRDGGRGSKRT